MRMYVRDCIYARTSMYILCMCDVYVLLMYTTCNLYGAVTSQATMYSFIHRHHYFCIRNENVNYIGISQVVVHLSACGAECIYISHEGTRTDWLPLQKRDGRCRLLIS